MNGPNEGLDHQAQRLVNLGVLVGLDFCRDLRVELQALLLQPFDKMENQRVVVDELEQYVDAIQLMEFETKIT